MTQVCQSIGSNTEPLKLAYMIKREKVRKLISIGKRIISPTKCGGAITICISIMAYELVVNFLPFEVTLGTTYSENQSFQIIKEVQTVKEIQPQN